MSEATEIKETRLVTLRISDKNQYYADKRGKEYEVTADVVLSGQHVELKSIPIPPELSAKIIAIIEQAAVEQITASMQQAQSVLNQRLAINHNVVGLLAAENPTE